MQYVRKTCTILVKLTTQLQQYMVTFFKILKLNKFLYSWRIVMILYYLVVFVYVFGVTKFASSGQDELFHISYLVHWTNFDSVLNMINWIRYPSKPDHQADHDNNQTVLPQAGKELSELL